MDETPLDVARWYTQGLVFPASKEEVLASFERNRAPQEAVELIRSKPHYKYSSPNEVMTYLREL